MNNFLIQYPSYEPKLICGGCLGNDHYQHRCRGLVNIPDYSVRVVQIGDGASHGREGIVYEGMASGLNQALVQKVCHCITCNNAYTNQAKAA